MPSAELLLPATHLLLGACSRGCKVILLVGLDTSCSNTDLKCECEVMREVWYVCVSVSGCVC